MLQSQPSIPDWLTAIVAVAALVQPWFIGLFKRLYRKPKIQIDLSGPATLSFGLRGSGLDLQTSLRAVNGDIFVTDSVVVLTNRRTSTKHVLDWTFTLTQTVDYQGSVRSQPVVASGFVIPERFGYLFRAEYYADDLSAATLELQERLANAFLDFVPVFTDEEAVAVVDDEYKVARLRADKFKSQSDLPVQVYSKLQNEFAWQHGEYDLTITLTTVDQSTFSASTTFVLSESEVDKLRANSATVVNKTMGLVRSTFYNAVVHF
jgi:hypothetical protein